jgi:colicin import membrane protein
MKSVLLSGIVLASALLGPARADDASAELERIKSQRQAVEARFAAEEKACQGRFGVNDCVDAARRARRTELADLRRQEVSVNDAERKRKAAARLHEIEEGAQARKQDAAGQRRAAALADQREREARAAEKADRKAQRQAEAADRARGPASAADKPPLGRQPTPEEAAASRAEHEQRLQEAMERKERVRKRAAKRSKPPASALPVPP